MKKAFATSTLLLAALQSQAQFVNSSLEQYNYQVGDGSIEVRSYDGFDEFEDVATLPGFSQYDFRVDGGAWETINYDVFYDAYKRGTEYPSLAAMLADRPENGTYEHRITWDNATTSTISLTGGTSVYADAIPNDPIFTMGGVTGGAWSRQGGEHNTGVFTFNPTQFADGQSFTVTLNTYVGDETGAGQASSVFVADITSSFNPIDDFALVNVPDWGLNDDLSAPIVLTFTKGAGPANAGDSDPLTFMFNDASRFELEGEHVNLLSLEDVNGVAGLADGTVQKGFVYQTVTNFIIEADTAHVPEPGSLALIGVGAMALLRRRR